MKFSVGFLDWLFGEKVQIELPDGETRKVSKRWLVEMQRQGKVRNVTDSMVRVHLLRPTPAMLLDSIGGRPIPTYQLAIWSIGDEVSQEQVEKHRDKKSGDLYAILMTRLDRSTMKFSKVPEPEYCTRESWNEQAGMNGVQPQ